MSKANKWSLILMAFAALVAGVYFAGRSGADPETYSNDFNVYYFASREVIAGRDPYQRSLGPWTPYLYPPVLCELMTPLALLPLPVAAYVWFLISAASTAAAAWMSAQLADGSASRRLLIAFGAVALVVRFVLDNFDYGQVNTVVAALAVAHLYLYSKKRTVASALMLMLAASIKLTPALFILYHVARRRVWFAAGCAALISAAVAASFLPFGAESPQAFGAFVNRTLRNEQGFDLAYSGNQSLGGAIRRLAADPERQPTQRSQAEATGPANPIAVMISIALLVAAVLAAAPARSELAAAVPFFCCLVIVSPLSWKAHFVVLILPLAYLISQAVGESGGWRRSLSVFGLIVAGIAFNLTSPKIIGPERGEWADAHSFVLMGAIILYMIGLALAFKNNSRVGSDRDFALLRKAR